MKRTSSENLKNISKKIYFSYQITKKLDELLIIFPKKQFLCKENKKKIKK